jgi:hypothetical protein
MIELDVRAARVPNMPHARYSRDAKDNHARLVRASRLCRGPLRQGSLAAQR